MSRVVVIGAGLAGLATACHLSGSGHDVTLIEAEDAPGGRAGQIVRDGFRFDTGPTVLTMRSLLEDVVGAAGGDLDALLPMQRLDPAYRATYSDGSEILVRHGHEAMRAEIAEKSGAADAAAFDRFVPWLKRLYEVEMPHFIDANFDTPLDLVRNPRAAASLVTMGGFGRLGPAVKRRFIDDRLRRLFTFQAMYAGLPPSSALAIYAVITYMDCIEGVYFPDGGMAAVPHALAKAATDNGVDLRLGQKVTRVLRRPDGPVAGVEIDAGPIKGSEKLMADAVVCTLDLPVAYRHLLPDLAPPRVVRTGDYSPSAVVWHVGARGDLPAGARHHNIHFADAWDSSFDALIKQGRMMPDPSRLVTIPSLTDPTAAPDGAHTLYVLEPAPNLDGVVDWRTQRGRTREELLAFLEREGYPTDIVTEELVDPLDWQAQGMERGTPFALAHTFAQTGPFRPSNVEKRLPGFFFAGSGTVPGVGVPMVLVSGRLAAERVTSYLPTVPRRQPRITTTEGAA
ncbi:phytoene desaturase family protein [Nocardioides bruguierae]|uniref:Phytoene desaturase family protein n=1 Tax=Nocardioides bruguierae TaxID=2945102 RepID=A0A9X2IHI1_9ACTN|nr:phytoene desaturase family protein [Nocardioides bruguierae]MCM0621820.1 phytoene desaturase family protein [Nocardioides bruguierae]